MTYAGDIGCVEACTLLQSRADAVLIDVRTPPEWKYVGAADLSDIGRQVVFCDFNGLVAAAGGMHPGAFVAHLVTLLKGQAAAGAAHMPPLTQWALLFMCRTGGRSTRAAMAMTEAGYPDCRNVAGGFEGPLNENGQRGKVQGWKAEGLPWRQD